MRTSLAFLVFIGGCGSTSATAPGTDGGAGSGTDAGTQANDPTSVLSSPTFDRGGGIARISYVTATNFSSGGGMGNASLLAQLYDVSNVSSAYFKTPERVGSCDVLIIPPQTQIGGSLPTYVSAGALRLEGGVKELAIDLDPGKPYYASGSFDSALWSGGETLKFTAAGAAIPAFSTTVAAPTTIRVTKPESHFPAAVQVSRSKELVTEWTGTSAGSVLVSISGPNQDANKPNSYITCAFSGADSHATIPANVMQRIDRAGSGSIRVSTVSAADVSAGDWGTIRVRAESEALEPGSSGRYAANGATIAD